MRLTKLTRFALLVGMLLWQGGCNEKPKTVPHFKTHWTVKTSFKYDLGSFIGILTGRELYKKYYSEVQAEWTRLLPPPVTAALKKIDAAIGPHQPPGPRLCIWFSVLAAEDSIAAILAALDDEAAVRRRLTASDFSGEKNWQQWQTLQPHLRTVLAYLQKAGFEGYWYQTLYPKITAKLPRVQQELQSYDVTGDIERFLRNGKVPDSLEVLALWLLQPHAIRLTPQCYLTDANYPMYVTVKSAYHELLHPHGEALVDSVLAESFAALRADPFLQQKLAQADPALGYRNFQAYAREEVVLAADLFLSERRRVISQLMGVNGSNAAEAVRLYLERHEGGVHVLAGVIYSYLEAGLKLDRMSYAAFLKELFASDRLQVGKIESRYRDFVQNKNLASP
ncbi:MAG: hypothetical protein ALAOOOJD_02740 [bacterium]|nr:hypothetical protein [bacterium]